MPDVNSSGSEYEGSDCDPLVGNITASTAFPSSTFSSPEANPAAEVLERAGASQDLLEWAVLEQGVCSVADIASLREEDVRSFGLDAIKTRRVFMTAYAAIVASKIENCEIAINSRDSEQAPSEVLDRLDSCMPRVTTAPCCAVPRQRPSVPPLNLARIVRRSSSGSANGSHATTVDDGDGVSSSDASWSRRTSTAYEQVDSSDTAASLMSSPRAPSPPSSTVHSLKRAAAADDVCAVTEDPANGFGSGLMPAGATLTAAVAGAAHATQGVAAAVVGKRRSARSAERAIDESSPQQAEALLWNCGLLKRRLLLAGLLVSQFSLLLAALDFGFRAKEVEDQSGVSPRVVWAIFVISALGASYCVVRLYRCAIPPEARALGGTLAAGQLRPGTPTAIVSALGASPTAAESAELMGLVQENSGELIESRLSERAAALPANRPRAAAGGDGVDLGRRRFFQIRGAQSEAEASLLPHRPGQACRVRS